MGREDLLCECRFFNKLLRYCKQLLLNAVLLNYVKFTLLFYRRQKAEVNGQ